MVEDSSFHDWQAESHPARFRRAEGRKNLFAQVGGNAAPVVLDGNDNASGPAPFTDRLGRQRNSGLRLPGCRRGGISDNAAAGAPFAVRVVEIMKKYQPPLVSSLA